MNYTIRQWLKEAQEQLEQHDKPSREARYMVEHVLAIPLAQLLLEYDRQIESSQLGTLNTFLHQRLQGIPLQHLTHEQLFMGHIFHVNEHVLIPRPETEGLVEHVEAILMKMSIEKRHHVSNQHAVQEKEAYRVLDLCTGSGCIIISLKERLRRQWNEACQWYGSDLSSEAIAIARLNEKQITDYEDIHWFTGSLFDPLPKEIMYDVIVSNPPYIPAEDMKGLMEEVRDYEPEIALTDGKDGLTFYHQIACEGFKRLKSGGTMAFEIGHGQMKEVIDIMIKNGYNEVVGHHDYAGLERQVIGKKPIIPD